MGQCVKCGGNTAVRARVGVGAYDYCARCGPRWTPPYTPARIALARGEPLILPAEPDSNPEPDEAEATHDAA